MNAAARPVSVHARDRMRLILPLLMLLLVAACRPGPQAAVSPDEPGPRLDYPGKIPIPVRLDLLATADGGRVVAIAGAWRGNVEFDGGATARCGINPGGLSELPPGGSYPVKLVCSKAVQLPADGSRGFRVFEDGRLIASGVVRP